MKQRYNLFLTTTIFLWSLVASGQTANLFTIPSTSNGTSGNGRGPVTQFLFHRSCAIYSATELAGSLINGDSIIRVGWSINAAAAANVTGTITVYLANTSDATFLRSTTWATLLTTPTAMTQVYSGSMTIPNAVGVYSIALQNPFRYTGGGLYVAYEWTPAATSTAAVYNCNTSITNGVYNAQSNTALPTTIAGSNFRPQVILGVKPPKVDLNVREIYTLGKLPIPYSVPHNVRAYVSNTGADTLYNYPITLNISGANSFIDTVRVDTFYPATNRYITFNNFTPLNLGTNSVVVSVPFDSVNTNNSKQFTQIVTTGSYSYANPVVPAAGGVGFTGLTGDFVAKFPLNTTSAINQIGVNFNTGGQNLRIGIWDTSASGTPGVLLWQSPIFTTQTGLNTITVNPPVNVNGSFFAGVLQINTTNAAFAYQNEVPIRNQTFYYTSPTGGTAWTDFSSTASNFRFMIEPRLQVADDVGIASVEQPCPAIMAGGAPIVPQFRITNYGLNAQASFRVVSQITGPVNQNSIDTLNGTLASGTTTLLNSNMMFNPTTPGVYTLKVWTELAGDLERNNDTVSYQFNVITVNNADSSVNGLQFTGTNYATIRGDGSLNITGDKLTLECWVNRNASNAVNTLFAKDSSATISQYKLYINATGNLVFKLHTTNGLDSVISSATVPVVTTSHIAATYNGSAMEIYLNGNLVATKSLSGNILGNTQLLNIGRGSFGGEFYQGAYDEIKIWDTCRTINQIRESMHRRLPNAAHLNLKGYYRLDELLGSYMVDASGNCNTLIINNPGTAFVQFTYPLGSPIVESGTMTIGGLQSFSQVGLTLNTYNQVGSNDYVIHRFNKSPFGTSPFTNPGGITSVYNSHWIIYRYGSGTIDSAEATFSIAGINSGASLSDLKLYNRPNAAVGAWTLLGASASAINTTNQTVSFNLLTSGFNAQFAIGAVNNPLPVTWVDFSGKHTEDNAQLTWSVAAEKNNKGYFVERSIDGVSFEEIDFVNGKGDHTYMTSYTYTDYGVFKQYQTAYYRLRQVDFNGKFTYSKTVMLTASIDADVISSVYPNPMNNQLNIELGNVAAEKVTLNVFDVTGKLVQMVELPVNNGKLIQTNELSGLHSGIYMLQITHQNKLVYQTKLIKTN